MNAMNAVSQHDHSLWSHDHLFGSSSAKAEASTRLVTVITLLMMVVEILAGWWFNSMALLADGWHMSSHALALGLAALAYAAARRYARDSRFAFGTWKIEVLAGFVSAMFLLVVAAGMVWDSVDRLVAPQPIHFPEAIAVAVLGLVVNLVCALILNGSHGHHQHGHDLDHGHHDHGRHHHDHGDLNLKAAYIHVLTDAATSVLAILALVAGMFWGWSWLDPAMGIVGAVLVAVWAKGLLLEAGRVLLDCEMDHPVVTEIRTTLRDRWPLLDVADLHVWRVGQRHFAAIISLVSHDDGPAPDEVRALLAEHEELAHLSVEVNHCRQ